MTNEKIMCVCVCLEERDGGAEGAPRGDHGKIGLVCMALSQAWID